LANVQEPSPLTIHREVDYLVCEYRVSYEQMVKLAAQLVLTCCQTVVLSADKIAAK